jgi:hypothetical protein
LFGFANFANTADAPLLVGRYDKRIEFLVKRNASFDYPPDVQLFERISAR